MSLPTFPEDLNLASYYLFDRLREGFADTPAVRFGEQVQTYAQVADDVQKLQRYLSSVGEIGRASCRERV